MAGFGEGGQFAGYRGNLGRDRRRAAFGTNWQALASLPTEAFWRQFQGRVALVQTFQQVAIKNQAAFTSGLHQAIESWHKAVSSALGSDNSASPFADVFKQWNALWSQTTEATQRKAPKGD